MGNGGVEGDCDDSISPGPVHRSHARELGAVLWGLALVTIIGVGRYATIERVQATIQDSWVVLGEVFVVVTVFAVLSPIFAAYLTASRV
ncbi:hypothetical protein [Halorubrum sp. GN11GM_10-3_MGM]|uniref:hypothetical protein n=1 Tax=Halorubrum sp. GN11GM_10-3_MGM TaxID=2518111 RepID=UPI0010F8C7FE|nr:hypothetical protein [Halorubrum sp. GN11GM_10-3_MGM]TKX66964.1 hypothetical protein EXE40_15515 [Halorubrum sp. GN11GM_10-3_MGM]